MARISTQTISASRQTILAIGYSVYGIAFPAQSLGSCLVSVVWHPTLAVTKKEREWMDQLCALIRIETDPAKFATLVRELNELLENKEYRLLIEVRERAPLRSSPKLRVRNKL